MEFSYIADNDLYKRIEEASALWILLEDIICLEILWNKEVTKTLDNDFQFLKKIFDEVV